MIDWQILDTWTVVVGILCALSCSLLGNFMVLRRMSMMGDAISHAVLPGIAIAFIIAGSRDSVVVFIGAAVAGMLTTVLTQVIHQWGRVESSASMGVVFTTLFALGLVLIAYVAHDVDLDPGCVLYGSIEMSFLDQVALTLPGSGPMYVPRAAVVLSIVLAINVAAVAIFYKELKLSSFDPELATTLGFNATAMHYMLMMLVALTTVAAFEVVGSILVVAMLIVPPATAHLLTDRLSSMIGVSAVVAILTAALGHLSAMVVPIWIGFPDVSTSTAGMMAVVAGTLFTIAVFAAPRHGVATRWARRAALSHRILCEDILGFLFRIDEVNGTKRPTVTVDMIADATLARAVFVRIAIASLRRSKDIEPHATHGWVLTNSGRENGTRLVRSHRIWEVYLAEHFDIPVDHLHGPASLLEHLHEDNIRERLADESGRPDVDPHGSIVP